MEQTVVLWQWAPDGSELTWTTYGTSDSQTIERSWQRFVAGDRPSRYVSLPPGSGAMDGEARKIKFDSDMAPASGSQTDAKGGSSCRVRREVMCLGDSSLPEF